MGKLEETRKWCSSMFYLFIWRAASAIASYSYRKLIDSSRTPTLTPKGHQGTIIAKLATPILHDLQLLLQIHLHKIPGVIVEVSGLILATFRPILENIKYMMGRATLPFQEWIVPDLRNTRQSCMQMSPPRYTRKHKFAFPPNSIV